jgi:WD40 repeat protein
MISARPSEENVDKILPPLLSKAAAALENDDSLLALQTLKEARKLRLPKRSPELDSFWHSLYKRLARLELRDIYEENILAGGLSGEVADYRCGLLVLADNKTLKFVKNPDSKAPGTVEVRLSTAPVSVSLSPGAVIAAALTDDGHLWLFNPLTGAGAGQALAHVGAGCVTRFRSDGRRLFTAGVDGQLKMWDTAHGYLDKGTPLLVKKLSEHPLQAMAFSPNGRLLSISDGYVEYRLPADKLSGPVRTLPMTGPGQEPRKLVGLEADPFNRYLLSAHQEGLTFHPLFDTDWRADLGNLGSAAQALALSPDARLLAVALTDGRLLLGLAPDQKQNTFLPIRRIESGPICYLGFSADSSHLLTAGRTGVGIYSLDWDLEPVQTRPWNKMAEIILGNFASRHISTPFSEKMAEAFLTELINSGLTGHDRKSTINRLKEALDRLNGS